MSFPLNKWAWEDMDNDGRDWNKFSQTKKKENKSPEKRTTTNKLKF